MRTLILCLLFSFQLLTHPPVLGADPVWPLGDQRTLTSNFAEWRGDRFHTGMDFRTQHRTGLAVSAPWDGQVVRISANWRGYGKALYIEHANGLITVYGHLERFRSDLEELLEQSRQKTGRKWGHDLNLDGKSYPVRAGETVAWTGETGIGFPHLHFETRKGMSKPLSPQAAGFLAPDSRAPEVLELIFLPLSPDTLIMGRAQRFALAFPGSSKKDKKRVRSEASSGHSVTVQGPFALAAVVLDRGDGADNRMAPASLELFLDGRKIFSRTKQSLDFSENFKGGTVYDLRSPGFSAGGLTEFLFHQPGGIWSPGPAQGGNLSAKTGKPVLFRGRWSEFPGCGVIRPDSMASGAHVLKVVAKDHRGNEGSREVKLLFDQAPDIRILDPARASDSDTFRVRFHDSDVRRVKVDGKFVSSGDLVDRVLVDTQVSGKWKRVAQEKIASGSQAELAIPIVHGLDMRAACVDALGVTSEWVLFPAVEKSGAETDWQKLPNGTIDMDRDGFLLSLTYSGGPKPVSPGASPMAVLVSGKRGCRAELMARCAGTETGPAHPQPRKLQLTEQGKKVMEKSAAAIWPMKLDQDGAWRCIGDPGIIAGPALEVLVLFSDRGLLINPGGKSSCGVTPITGKYPVHITSDDDQVTLEFEKDAVLYTTLGGIDTGSQARGWKLGSLGRAYSTEPWGVTLLKNCRISFRLPAANSRGAAAKRVGIYSRNSSDEPWSCIGGKASRGSIQTSLRHLNQEYALFLDTQAPIISKLRVKTEKSGKRIVFLVKDHGEGVDPSGIEITIGGKKVDSEYDPDRASVETDSLSSSQCPVGASVIVRVCDRAGNWSAKSSLKVPASSAGSGKSRRKSKGKKR